MSDDNLTQRRNWFRFFPEGSIEFILVTRVLALLLLAGMIVVHDRQRPMVVMALVFVLWIDYLLMMWWAVQMATDLQDLFQQPPPSAEESHRRRIWNSILASLPSVAALGIIAPWPRFMIRDEITRAMVMRMGGPVLLILFIVFAISAQRLLQRLRLGPPIWTLLLWIPLVHWLAMHRLMVGLNEDITRRLADRGKPGADNPSAGVAVAIAIADITWILSVLPWGIVLILSLLSRGWPASFPYSMTPICGTLFACIFSVADLAGMENVQRRFVSLLRKL